MSLNLHIVKVNTNIILYIIVFNTLLLYYKNIIVMIIVHLQCIEII